MNIIFNTLAGHSFVTNVNPPWYYPTGYYAFQIGSYLHNLRPDSTFFSDDPDTSNIIEISMSTHDELDKFIPWYNEIPLHIQHIVSRKKWLFSVGLEPTTTPMYTRIERIASELNIPLSNIAVFSSNASPNLQTYTKLTVITTTTAYMQWHCRKWFDHQTVMAATTSQSWKPFIMLIAKPRPHRIEFLNNFANSGLLSDTHATLGSHTFQFAGFKCSGAIEYADYVDMCVEYKLKPNPTLVQYLPFHTDGVNVQFNWSSIAGTEIVNESFGNSYITSFGDSECGLDSEYFSPTEKTWRPIHTNMPFVLNTTTKAVEMLSSLGYYQFEDEYEIGDMDSTLKFLERLKQIPRHEMAHFKKTQRLKNQQLFDYHSTNDYDDIHTQLTNWISK